MKPVIDAEQAAWMLSGAASLIVASRDAAHRPSIAQGLGCRIAEGRSQLTVFLLEAPNRALVADLRAGADVSVLVTESATTRSLQLKAHEARERQAVAADLALLDAHADALARQWGGQGQPSAFTHALLARGGDTVLAFELTPYVAFDQTPGPRAGATLARTK